MRDALIWIAILCLIGLLLAILLPALAADKQCGGKYGERRCASTLNSIGLAFSLYQQKYGDLPPPGRTRPFEILFATGMLSDPDGYVCPRDDETHAHADDRLAVLSYESWFGGAPGRAAMARHGSRFPIAWDRRPFHGGMRVLLFLDGHAECHEEEDFAKILRDAAREFGLQP